MQVVDLGNPSSPRALGSFPTPGFALGLARHRRHVLVACREAGIQVLDLADPTQPKLVGSYLSLGAVEPVAVEGDRAFIADGLEGFMALDVSDPTRPKRLGLAPGGTQARSIAMAGHFAYVADVTRGIRVFEVGDPTHPREVGGTSAINTYRLVVSGDRLLAAAGMSGLVEFAFYGSSSSCAPRRPTPGTGRSPARRRVAGASVVVQRSPDLERWLDGPSATLEASPVTVPVPAGNSREFFRLKRP